MFTFLVLFFSLIVRDDTVEQTGRKLIIHTRHKPFSWPLPAMQNKNIIPHKCYVFYIINLVAGDSSTWQSHKQSQDDVTLNSSSCAFWDAELLKCQRSRHIGRTVFIPHNGLAHFRHSEEKHGSKYQSFPVGCASVVLPV